MSFPEKIQAITIAKTGDVDVLEKTEVDFPQAAPGDIVVKIAYGGVNFIDTYFRKGLYPIKDFPAIQGTESSGTIVRLPTDDGVLNDENYKKRGYQVGDRVAVYKSGGFAEYVSAPWNGVYKVLPSISLQTAAAALTSGLTAITFITEAYEVKKGDTIFVHTIAGALGLCILQLAKARGATVIGTTSTAEKAKLAKDHGADHVILYKDEDTVKRTMEITNGQGVEAVFDGVGKDTFELDFEILKRKGTLVSIGNASGAVPPMAPLKLVTKNLKLLRPTMGNYVVTPDEAYYYGNELWKSIESGQLKINVYKEYPFSAEGVRQAQTDLVGGHTTGKLLIKIGDD